jgi:hypothetical protein
VDLVDSGGRRIWLFRFLVGYARRVFVAFTWTVHVLVTAAWALFDPAAQNVDLADGDSAIPASIRSSVRLASTHRAFPAVKLAWVDPADMARRAKEELAIGVTFLSVRD